jgi:hypothetical protein
MKLSPITPERILRRAAERMRVRFERRGAYPAVWFELMDGAGGRALPKRSDRERWSPRELEHELVIARADGEGFAIQAIDDRGRATWEVTDRDTSPRQLLPMYCTRETYFIDRHGEAPAFMRWAMEGFRWFRRSAKARYPHTWGESRIHWCVTEHFMEAPEALPPAGAGLRWRPKGSRHVFHLESSERHYIIWSSNDAGIANYILEGPAGEPTELSP